MIIECTSPLSNYDQSWPQFYQRWLLANSALAIFLALGFLVVSSPVLLLSLVISFILLGQIALLSGGKRIGPVVGVSNLITSVRSITAVGLMVWLLSLELRTISLGTHHFWIITGILVVAELTDLFDGFVARKVGPTEFGAVWDMENDVAFSYVLCLLAYGYVGIGPWIILSTLIRHGYILIFRFQNDPPSCPRSFKWFAKTVCAFQLIALISLFVPVLPMGFKIGMNVLSILSLFWSFGWDLILRLGRTQTE